MEAIIDVVKTIVVILLMTLAFGTVGAIALTKNVVIAGAVCFLIVGFLLGTLFGFFVANLEADGDGEDGILR